MIQPLSMVILFMVNNNGRNNGESWDDGTL